MYICLHVKYRYTCRILMKLEFEICTLLACYAASNGNPLPTFQDNISVLDFLTLDISKPQNSANLINIAEEG